MKVKRITCTVRAALLTVLAATFGLSAQERATSPGQKQQHSHYRLVDLGTLGGPNSTISDTLVPMNRTGTVVGAADTLIHDPFDPNCVVAEECLVLHTFQWRNGILTDLGALTNGASSLPNAINGAGVAVGISENGLIDPQSVFPPEFDAVVWKNGRIIDLGTLGGTFSLASDINDKNQVVGFALNTLPDSFFMDECGGGPMPTQMRAFIWQEGNAMQDLGTLGGPDSCALWINHNGQVAGHSFVNSTPNSATGIPTVHPFLWTKFGGMVDLGSLGGTVTHTSGLNNRGQVAGDSNLVGDLTQNAFLWDGEHMKNVTPGATYSFAEGLNDNGQVVGGAFYETDPPGFAFLWSDGALINLVRCAGARSINSDGQVVGFVLGGGADCTEAAPYAFLWEDGGPAIDLNTLVRPPSDLQLLDAQFINDRGEITGTAVLPNGEQHAYVLIPEDSIKLPLATNPTGPAQSEVTPDTQRSSNALQSRMTPERLAAMRAQLAHRHRSFGFRSPKAVN